MRAAAAMRLLRNSSTAVALALAGVFAFGAESDTARPIVPLEVRTVRFSPDGRSLAVSFGLPDGAGAVQVWDLAEKRLRFRREDSTGIGAVAWSADGAVLAAGNYAGETRLVAAADFRVLTELRGHVNAARGVAFSPSGGMFATAGWDNTARLWNAASGAALHVLAHRDRVNAVAFSADGELLATAANDSTARLWDASTGEERRSFQHDGYIVRGLAFTSDGRHLATACWDGRVRLWDVETGERWMRIDPQLGGVDCITIGPDGRLLAAAGVNGRTVALVRVPTEGPAESETRRIAELLALLDHDDYAVRQQADEELAAFGMAAEPALRGVLDSLSAEVRIRARRLRERAMAPGPERVLTCGADVTALDFSPAGEQLAVGLRDGRVVFFDVASGAEAGVLREP